MARRLACYSASFDEPFDRSISPVWNASDFHTDTRVASRGRSNLLPSRDEREPNSQAVTVETPASPFESLRRAPNMGTRVFSGGRSVDDTKAVKQRKARQVRPSAEALMYSSPPLLLRSELELTEEQRVVTRTARKTSLPMSTDSSPHNNNLSSAAVLEQMFKLAGAVTEASSRDAYSISSSPSTPCSRRKERTTAEVNVFDRRTQTLDYRQMEKMLTGSHLRQTVVY